MKTYTLPLTFIGLALFLIVALLTSTDFALGGDLDETPIRDNFQTYEFFDSSSSSTLAYAVGTTTSATSTDVTYTDSTTGRIDNGYLVIAGADAVTFTFGRSSSVGGASGTSTFYVDVSPDGTTWIDANKLITNVANTNAQTLTRVASVALTGTSSASYALDLSTDTYYAVRCVVVETTDGTHRCRASAKF